jgi:hypothetical protein
MSSNLLTGPVMLAPHNDANTRHTTAQVTLGSRAFSEDGEFVYVTAAGAISTSGSPVVAPSGFASVVNGDRDLGGLLGVCDAPFASGESGYVRTKGPITAVVASGVVAGDELELSATAGQFKKITTSGQAVAMAFAASPNADGRTAIYLFGR